MKKTINGRTIVKTVYAYNLRPADSYTVECGRHKKTFPASDPKAVGKWIMDIWESEIFPYPAYVYYNIDWDCDHILYCKYELT